MPVNKDNKWFVFNTFSLNVGLIYITYHFWQERGEVYWDIIIPAFCFSLALFGGAVYELKKPAPPIDNKYTPIRTQNKSQNMICPYCQNKGTVSIYRDKVKNGISGGKLTGAILTGGLSLLATGLSRKTEVSKAQCSKCGAEWTF